MKLCECEVDMDSRQHSLRVNLKRRLELLTLELPMTQLPFDSERERGKIEGREKLFERNARSRGFFLIKKLFEKYDFKNI